MSLSKRPSTKPSTSWDVREEARHLATRGVCLGTNRASGRKVYLPLDSLSMHLHCTGTTGQGKTSLFAWIAALLAEVPRAAIILVDPKGDVVERAMRFLVAHGHARRVVLFDPRIRERVLGFNPLRPNGLPIVTQCKAVRDAILASSQTNEDIAAQLSRLLLMALVVARSQELTLTEALDLLRPTSVARTVALERVLPGDAREVQKSLRYFDSLSASRQDELSASALARLEPFVMDPLIRQVLTQSERSLNFGTVMRRGEIVLINFKKFEAVSRRDAQLLGRLVVNDVLAHAFARPAAERTPVFLIADEIQDLMTRDFADVVSQGRGLGLHFLGAHQYLHQLEDGPSQVIRKALTNCARTKLAFSTPDADDLDFFARQLFIDRFDPRAVLDPRLARRSATAQQSRTTGASVTRSNAIAKSRAKARGVSESEAASHSRTYSASVQQTRGRSRSAGASRSTTTSTGTTRGVQQGTAQSVSRDAAGEQAVTDQESCAQSEAEFAGHAESTGASRSLGEQESTGESEGVADTYATSRTTTESVSTTVGKTRTRTRSESAQVGFGASRAVSLEPLSREAFFAYAAGAISRQAQGQFIVKPPVGRAVFVQAPFVEVPTLTNDEVRQAIASILSRDCYATVAQIEREERTRIARLTSHVNEGEPSDVWSETH